MEWTTSFPQNNNDAFINLIMYLSDMLMMKINSTKYQLSILKGEFIVLVGVTGSGKSTFVDLVLGLLKPSKGNIV